LSVGYKAVLLQAPQVRPSVATTQLNFCDTRKA